MNRSLEIQKAMYIRLKSELSYDIYASVPQKSEYPFIVIGYDYYKQDDTQTETFWNGTMDIHSFSRNPDFIELKTMMKDIYESLHQQPLIPGNVDLLLDSETIVQEPDGVSWHGIQTFNIIIAG